MSSSRCRPGASGRGRRETRASWAQASWFIRYHGAVRFLTLLLAGCGSRPVGSAPQATPLPPMQHPPALASVPVPGASTLATSLASTTPAMPFACVSSTGPNFPGPRPECPIDKPCPSPELVLAPCADTSAIPLSIHMQTASRSVASDDVVRVRGWLGFDPRRNIQCTAAGCECCNKCDGAMELRDWAYGECLGLPVVGEGLHCGGWESHLCCPADTLGKEVIVTGRRRPEFFHASSICVVEE